MYKNNFIAQTKITLIFRFTFTHAQLQIKTIFFFTINYLLFNILKYLNKIFNSFLELLPVVHAHNSISTLTRNLKFFSYVIKY